MRNVTWIVQWFRLFGRPLPLGIALALGTVPCSNAQSQQPTDDLAPILRLARPYPELKAPPVDPSVPDALAPQQGDTRAPQVSSRRQTSSSQPSSSQTVAGRANSNGIPTVNAGANQPNATGTPAQTAVARTNVNPPVAQPAPVGDGWVARGMIGKKVPLTDPVAPSRQQPTPAQLPPTVARTEKAKIPAQNVATGTGSQPKPMATAAAMPSEPKTLPPTSEWQQAGTDAPAQPQSVPAREVTNNQSLDPIPTVTARTINLPAKATSAGDSEWVENSFDSLPAEPTYDPLDQPVNEDAFVQADSPAPFTQEMPTELEDLLRELERMKPVARMKPVPAAAPEQAPATSPLPFTKPSAEPAEPNQTQPSQPSQTQSDESKPVAEQLPAEKRIDLVEPKTLASPVLAEPSGSSRRTIVKESQPVVESLPSDPASLRNMAPKLDSDTNDLPQSKPLDIPVRRPNIGEKAGDNQAVDNQAVDNQAMDNRSSGNSNVVDARRDASDYREVLEESNPQPRSLPSSRSDVSSSRRGRESDLQEQIERFERGEAIANPKLDYDVVDESIDRAEQPQDVAPKKQQPVQSPATAPVISASVLRLDQPIRQCLAYYHQRPENAAKRTPWGMLHAILPFGLDAYIDSNKRYNAIAYLAGNNPGRNLRMLSTTNGGRIVARSGVGLQGHQAQTLAIFAQVGVPADYALIVNKRKFIVNDLVKTEMLACKAGEELTFTLMGLSHYLPTDTKWRSADGQAWDFERLLKEEMAQPVVGAACGGTHRLMGLTYALRQRKLEGLPLTGQWARAETYLSDFEAYAWQLQNRDGSFSTDWFEGRADSGDIDRKLQTSGHILEWLVFAADNETLQDERVIRGITFLANNLINERSHEWQVGPKGHALRALSLFHRRTFSSDRPWLVNDTNTATRATSSRQR